MTEQYRPSVEEQFAQYPGLQEGAGINGLQAGHVIEQANRINNARDIIARHSDADPTMLNQEITDAEKEIDIFLGKSALKNLAQKPSEPDQPTPEQPPERPRHMRVVNEDGRIVPYGQMTRNPSGRHPQTGRIISY